MRIATQPTQYQGAFGEVVYTIVEADPQQIVDVEIYSSSEGKVIGLKRYRNQSEYQVNVANYLQQQFNIEPFMACETAVVSDPSRSVYYTISVNEVQYTPQKIATAGFINAPQGCFMTDAPQMRPISVGQSEELSMVIDSGQRQLIVEMENSVGERVALSIGGGVSNGLINVVNINMDHLDTLLREKSGRGVESCVLMRVVVESEACGRMSHSYRIVSPQSGGVRLCWLNPYGAIDYYTFAQEVESSVSVKRTKVYGRSGYMIVDSQMQSSNRLVSHYEPQATMKWLSQLLGSPKVWVCEAHGYRRVDIVTSSVLTHSPDMVVMNLEMRDAQNTNFQRL